MGHFTFASHFRDKLRFTRTRLVHGFQRTLALLECTSLSLPSHSLEFNSRMCSVALLRVAAHIEVHVSYLALELLGLALSHAGSGNALRGPSQQDCKHGLLVYAGKTGGDSKSEALSALEGILGVVSRAHVDAALVLEKRLMPHGSSSPGLGGGKAKATRGQRVEEGEDAIQEICQRRRMLMTAAGAAAEVVGLLLRNLR